MSNAAVPALPAGVGRFDYDRDGQAVGIVHFGIGAFHRAHQAWYTDRAMDAGDRDWAIAGVSMRSPDVAEQLNPQDGLYTVTERSPARCDTRLIGAVRHVHMAAHEHAAVVARLADASTRIITLTITEKGYHRAADGTLDAPAQAADSIYPLLAAGLLRRRDAGHAGLTLLSCDNLARNGEQLAALMAAYLAQHQPALLPWFERECTCPSTMVDRIVPATQDTDRTMLLARHGFADAGAVMTEPFSQWVIEDRFANARPRWEAVGAQLVADVHPYETAKLRLLNGAHSLMAYVGLARRHRHVHQAIADPAIKGQVDRLMREEAAPTIDRAADQDFDAYANSLIERFANAALAHRLEQIAIDGSQKLPQRWLETLALNQKKGRSCPAILGGIAAWIAHLRGANGPVDDPRASELAIAVRDGNAVARLFAPGGAMASAWVPEEEDLAIIARYLEGGGGAYG